MTLIFNSNTNQQLLGLAGRDNGSSPIGFWDRWNAGSAKPHPVSNRIYGVVEGTLRALSLSTSGLMAYPFVYGSIRNTILGTAADVCTTCAMSTKKIADLCLQLNNVFGGSKITPLEEFAVPFLAGGSAFVQCAAGDAKIDLSCRALNYTSAILDFAGENSLLIAGGTAALIALCTFLNINSYKNAEKESEASMIKDLKGRFLTIAQQLEADAADAEQDNNTTAEVQQLATAILIRRVAIEKEILDLGLPSLSKDTVSVITQPLFDAITKIREVKTA